MLTIRSNLACISLGKAFISRSTTGSRYLTVQPFSGLILQKCYIVKVARMLHLKRDRPEPKTDLFACKGWDAMHRRKAA